MWAVRMLRAFVVWVLIAVLAVSSAFVREMVLVPLLGPVAGMTAGGLLVCAMILLVTWLTRSWLGATRRAELLLIGGIWLVLTLIFEFGMGILSGKPWEEILAPYTFTDGNIWPMVLLVTATAPLVIARFSTERPS
jgi:hypothetical protein